MFYLLFCALKIGTCRLHGYAVRIFRLFFCIFLEMRLLLIIQGEAGELICLYFRAVVY